MQKGKLNELEVSAPVVSVSPVVLSAPDRAVDLQMRVSAPVTGRELPIILFVARPGKIEQSLLIKRLRPARQFLGCQWLCSDPAHPSEFKDT